MLTFLYLLFLASLSEAQVHFPITKRVATGSGKSAPSEQDWANLRDKTFAKFSPKNSTSSRRRKRANSASVDVTDLGGDATYFASLSLGTPAKSFNVILDTGSSDLFIASSSCQSCQLPSSETYDPSASSTSKQLSQTVDLQYGSGEAEGSLTQDTVSMGGFTVQGQSFVLAEQVTDGLLQGDLSGLLGLGFQTIAQTQATPFVQQLAQTNQLSAPEMAFFLQRDTNSSPQEAPGGKFTLGGVDSSLMTGDIDFVNMPSGVQPSFWLLPVVSVGVQGTTLNVKSGQQSLAAIDSGTTLIGGPTDAVSTIYSNIQGSQPLGGQMQGYFSVPCSTNIQTSFNFGSKTWSINPEDMIVQQLSNTQCLGAIFGFDLGSQGGPDWVIGDTFLKNVYSVFRFTPPSVGFAQLSSSANNGGGSQGATPPTGSIPIQGPPIPTGGGNGGGSPASGGSAPFTTGNGFPGSANGAISIMVQSSAMFMVLLWGLLAAW